MTAARWPCLWVVVLSLLSSLAACGRPGDVRTDDLVSAFDDAAVLAEPGFLDVGTHGARPHLGDGWSHNERQGGSSFVWSLGSSSSLAFELVEARPIDLKLRGWPFEPPGSPAQEITVRVNGEVTAALAVRSGPAQYDLRIPADLLRAGGNALRLEYAWSRSPAEAGIGEDKRRLAMAWDWIRFDGRQDSPRPLADPKAGVLELPSGSQVEFFLNLPGPGELLLDGIEGAAGGLKLTLLPDGGPESDVRIGDDVAGRWTLGAAGLWRLRFAVPGRGGPGEGGVPEAPVRILRPRVETLVEPAQVAPESRSGLAGSRPNIVVYMVDTLRADHLGAYGYPKAVSPNLDAFARSGVLFESAVAQSSWTKAAVASVFTGLWPPAHGAVGIDDKLPGEVDVLAALLGREGYDTGAVVANAFVSEVFGFARGFEFFHFFRDRLILSDRIHHQALKWLDKRRAQGAEAPFFLYLHTIDPHVPYSPPEEFRRRFASRAERPELGTIEHLRELKAGRTEADAGTTADLVALYDADIAHNDHQFGLFLESLRERGLEGDTVILVTSDHGEAFYEHRHWTHGLDLYGEVLRVPLIVRGPGMPGGRRISDPVQHIDLLPTLLELAGTGTPAAGSGPVGRSLVPLLEGVAAGPEDPIYSHLAYFSKRGVSVRWQRWKLIAPLSSKFGDGPELFDLELDPGEIANLAVERPVVTGYLETLIRRQLRTSRPPTAETTELDPDTARQLEALGYLD